MIGMVEAYLLHRPREFRASVRQRLVDVFFAGDLVAHFDAIVEDGLVGLLGLLRGHCVALKRTMVLSLSPVVIFHAREGVLDS